jgi:hypothetical protein
MLVAEGHHQFTWSHSMDKDQYDRPEDENNVWSRGLGLLGGAVVVVGIFWVIFNTGVLK